MRLRAVVAALAMAGMLAGCTAPPIDPDRPAPPESSESSTPSETVPPDPGPRPEVGECHALSFRQAVAVVGRTEPVPCRRKHTAETYFVGRLEAGDARREHPPRRLRRGAASGAYDVRVPAPPAPRPPPRELRLKMVQAVWFTPSPKHAEAGADWFRCDVVAVASPKKLLPLPRRTKGWGDAPVVAMCATAAPDTRAFRRVACGAKHAWLAVATVDLTGRKLPTQAAIADRMESTCRDAARSRADDPLDFTWSQESPTEEQWQAGQRYGICWAPA